jgi:hypothetical protein
MQKTFSQILDDWFLRFDRMIPGQAIEIASTAKRDPKLFIDICKFYIDNEHPDYSFTNDYKYFKRDNQ